MSSRSFTVRSSNSCAALTQVHCESLYSDEKKNSISSLSARFISDEWQSEGKNRERKGQREKENLLLSVFTTGLIIPRQGCLHLHRRDLFWQCTHYLGTQHFKEGPALLSSPVHDLNSRITYKSLRQICKKEQCICWNEKHLYICSDATFPKRQLVP